MKHETRFGGQQLSYMRCNLQKNGSLLSFLSSIEVVVLDDAIQILCRESVSIRVCIDQFMYRWLCTNHTNYVVCESQTRIDHYIAQCTFSVFMLTKVGFNYSCFYVLNDSRV